jgi:DNA-binding GntR family transcriptional regulator
MTPESGAYRAVPIERAPLRREVRRVLLDRILRGDIAPGSSIHESDLAIDLGVSRTPLREALLGLEREGFLRSEAGRGFFAAPLTAEDAGELYPILWTLEGLALASSPAPAPSRLTELTRINADLARFERIPERALDLDRIWHDTLLSGCTNRQLVVMTDVLKDQARRYERAYMEDSGRVFVSTQQHEDILRALGAGQRDEAVRLLETNWRVSLDFLLPWLRGARS